MPQRLDLVLTKEALAQRHDELARLFLCEIQVNPNLVKKREERVRILANIGLEGTDGDAVLALEELGVDNAAVVSGDLEVGYPSEGPYDAIVIEGAVEHLPSGLLDQLKDGGRLVAVEAGRPSHAVVWRRLGRHFDRRVAFEAAAPAAPGFEKKQEFVF